MIFGRAFQILGPAYLLVSQCLAAATFSTGEDVASFVESMIEQNQVFVFSKSYCPHCRQAKGLLFELQHDIDVGVDYLEIDELPEEDGPLVQSYLMEKTGQRTVPSIFIMQKHVGGNSDLQQLHAAGTLEGLLLEAAKLGAPTEL